MSSSATSPNVLDRAATSACCPGRADKSGDHRQQRGGRGLARLTCGAGLCEGDAPKPTEPHFALYTDQAPAAHHPLLAAPVDEGPALCTARLHHEIQLATVAMTSWLSEGLHTASRQSIDRLRHRFTPSSVPGVRLDTPARTPAQYRASKDPRNTGPHKIRGRV